MKARLLSLSLAIVLAVGFNSCSHAAPPSEVLQGEWAESSMGEVDVASLMYGKIPTAGGKYGRTIAYIRIYGDKLQIIEGRPGIDVKNNTYTFKADAQNINLTTEFGDKYVLRYILQNSGKTNLMKIRNKDGSTTTYVQVVNLKEIAKAQDAKAKAEAEAKAKDEAEAKAKADAEALEREKNKNNRQQFTDSRDGKNYLAVKIGDKVWMAQNLNFQTKTGSCCYDNDESNCDKYGRLYYWSRAMGLDSTYNEKHWRGKDENHRGICPEGWHLPSKAEWVALIEYVGSSGGTKLKSTDNWLNGGNGTDVYWFSALPGGFFDAQYKKFRDVGDEGYWWTATEALDLLEGQAYYGTMNAKDDRASGSNDWKCNNVLSVRCVMNN